MAFNWTCPYCNSKTTITENDSELQEAPMLIENSEGGRVMLLHWVVCPNDECKKITLIGQLFNYEWGGVSWTKKQLLKEWVFAIV